MNKEYSTNIGSGTTSAVGYGPVHNLDPDQFPGAGSRDALLTRSGDGVVMLNFEDLSVSIGLVSSAVTVGMISGAWPVTPLTYRRALVVHNFGASTIFLGDVNVTIATDLPLLAGEKIAFDIQNNPNVVVYAVAGADTDVRLMELA